MTKITQKGTAYLIRAAHADVRVMDSLKAKLVACENGDEDAERTANKRVDDLVFIAGQYLPTDIEAAAYGLAGYLSPNRK